MIHFNVINIRCTSNMANTYTLSRIVGPDSHGGRPVWTVESDSKSFVVGRENPVDDDVDTRGRSRRHSHGV
jgi:hypothetical protein